MDILSFQNVALAVVLVLTIVQFVVSDKCDNIIDSVRYIKSFKMIPADEGHVVGEKKYINGEEVSKELFHEVSFLRRTTLKAANKLEVFLLRFRLVVCAIYSGVIITFVIKFLIDSILIGAVIFLVLLVMNFMFNTKSEILKYVNLLKEQQPDNAGKPD